MANLKDTTITDTGFLNLPVGTSNNRPSSPAAGLIRFNTDFNICEWYDDIYSKWYPTGDIPPVSSGGSTNDIVIDGITYRNHVFTSLANNTFTVTRGGAIECLIVGGGGGGGVDVGGAGGAGGVLYVHTLVSDNTTYNLYVGQGGDPNTDVGANDYFGIGNNGENSSAFGFTAFGGGSGGNWTDFIGNNGASGGGGPGRGIGRPGIPGQGSAGEDGSGGSYAAGAGGGAGQRATRTGSDNRGGNGGNGIFFSQFEAIAGDPPGWFGGGGGAGTSSIIGSGGLGGGSAGGLRGSSVSNAVSNTGGGGGGTGGRMVGSAGGSGIVIIRYQI